MKTKQRGMTLESLVNQTNLSYRKMKKALIVKKSTPLKLTGQGVVYQASTVDYSGLYVKDSQVIPLAFDAKETKNKTNFPLANIEDHQINFLTLWSQVGGEAFLLIYFIKLEKIYKVDIKFLNEFIKENSRKSIPISEFKEEWEVDIKDYLQLNV